MKSHNLTTWILLCTLVITYVFHTNPFNLWMPDMIGMALASVF
jgi:hypothetical protein